MKAIVIRVIKKIRRELKSIAILSLGAIFRGKTSKLFLSRFFADVFILPLAFFFRGNAFRVILYAIQYQRPIRTRVTKKLKVSYKVTLFISSVLAGDTKKSTDDYLKLLSLYDIPLLLQRQFATLFLRVGRLDLATLAFDLVCSKMRNTSLLPREGLIDLYREAGTAEFLYGKNDKANYYWQLAGQIRKTIYKPSTPRTYRILGNTWFAAIGHVAYLDYYIKFMHLYTKGDYHVVALNYQHLACADDFLAQFSKLGITLLKDDELEGDYNKWAIRNNALPWTQLSPTEKAGLTDEFWEWEFPDNQILSCVHVTNRIQKRWEKEKLPPLLSIDNTEKAWLGNFLLSLGLPAGAWYVCLHVRESGFHGKWNKVYPSMRDGNIDDYTLAINEIVNAGGWVIRMGDLTMKPLPPMFHVIDYIQSSLRDSVADRLISASCKFFLGTNSGLNMVPIIYGIPCALTNWVPIGWPLWPKQDLMIAKLFLNKNTNQILTIEEVFEQGLAFIQNRADLPSHIELINNTPEEIRDLTLEMLSRFSRVNYPLGNTKNDFDVHEGYAQLAAKYNTYAGSQFAKTFVDRHPDFFAPCKQYITIHETIEA